MILPNTRGINTFRTSTKITPLTLKNTLSGYADQSRPSLLMNPLTFTKSRTNPTRTQSGKSKARDKSKVKKLIPFRAREPPGRAAVIYGGFFMPFFKRQQ
jgi:hypothetical protein